MGRNRKVGLDWWPRDIGLYRDPKLRAARQKFGVLGPYVYECLLDIAYGDKGYYIAYSGEGPLSDFEKPHSCKSSVAL